MFHYTRGVKPSKLLHDCMNGWHFLCNLLEQRSPSAIVLIMNRQNSTPLDQAVSGRMRTMKTRADRLILSYGGIPLRE